jgi:hypothetical protein
MPRHVFTAHDLAPLRGLLSLPLAQEAFNAAVPVKRFSAAGRHVGERVALSVPVRSRDVPDGVPLPELLAALKKESPSVAGIAVRRGELIVTHTAPPARRERERVQRFLGDRDALARLRHEPVVPAVPPIELRRVLGDRATPDDEWLKAFRGWAAENLVQPDP